MAVVEEVAPGPAPVDGHGHRARLDSSVLIRIRGALPDLRPAERRVAEAALGDPAWVSESSITTVARQCQTSETTVLRFCRALGLAGYPELRIALARAAQSAETEDTATEVTTGTIDAADPLEAVVATVAYAGAAAVADTARAVDLAALQAAVTALQAARRIDVYGLGPSGLAAADLHLKLHRIGLVSFAWSDPHLALASAAVLTADDVAVGISHTGTTVDTLEALRAARRSGATTVALTNFGRSPLAGEADHVLLTAARETTFGSGTTVSRVAQTALVDLVFAGVAHGAFDRSLSALRAGAAAVETRHRERTRR